MWRIWCNFYIGYKHKKASTKTTLWLKYIFSMSYTKIQRQETEDRGKKFIVDVKINYLYYSHWAHVIHSSTTQIIIRLKLSMQPTDAFIDLRSVAMIWISKEMHSCDGFMKNRSIFCMKINFPLRCQFYWERKIHGSFQERIRMVINRKLFCDKFFQEWSDFFLKRL